MVDLLHVYAFAGEACRGCTQALGRRVEDKDRECLHPSLPKVRNLLLHSDGSHTLVSKRHLSIGYAIRFEVGRGSAHRRPILITIFITV